MQEAADPSGLSALDRKILTRRFHDQEAEVRLANYRRGALLALIFVVCGFVLDLITYPDLFLKFLLLRVACAGCLGVVLALLYLHAFSKASRILGHLVAFLPMLMIDVMLIWTPKVGESPYYAGLNLVMVGAVLLLRWRFSDGVSNALMCIGGYLAVAIAANTPWQAVGTNTFFLFVTAVFACVGLFFYNRLRFSEFCLREEVIEQQEALEENHRKLQDLDEAKTRFFANISHELRTPLTLILAPVEKMRSSEAVRRDPRLSEMIDSLEDNGMRLLRLINDLLDLVRLDSGEMPLRPESFAPAVFLDGLGRNLRPMAERKRINLTWTASCPEDQQVYLDRDRLEKIVLNLAVNALKFTPPSGRVGLSVNINMGQLELEVCDNGAGMRKDQVDSAFERFWQADTSIRRKHRGVGIGLALVKSLTESLKGTVAIDSVYGEGTTFRIKVPLTAIPPEKPPGGAEEDVAEEDVFEEIYQRARLHGAVQPLDVLPSATETSNVPTGFGGPRVLIAEDESGLRRFLRGELEDLGCEVIEASDGAIAWELARQFQPELIVLDFMMPELDGITLTKRLRENEGTSQLPIILITAHADDTPRIQALEAGVSDFLTKPFTTAELRVRIRNLLDRQSYQRQLGIKNKELGAALEELKENEARLLQAEKLSSLGRMSAGIVHEVNNPLNYTKTAIHALKMFEDDVAEEERADYVDVLGDVEEGVQRVIAIVSDLRSFTRGETSAREPIPIQGVVEMARRLVSHDLSGIRFEDTVPKGLLVNGNENQLCQVFVNLIQNATQSLDATRARGEEPLIQVTGQESPSGKVVIQVRDNGSGIQPEDLENIFDPFFTKREVGEGMGLGLSICHRIIASHEGRIDVESTLDRFTEFSITLPGVEEHDQGLEREGSDLKNIEKATTTP